MKSSTTVVIPAAGSGLRWQNYRGVPKHLTEIEGEKLIERTCHQFLKYTNNIVIVGPDDDRYRIPNTNLHVPVKIKGAEMEKITSGIDHWSEKRTVIAFGDVYFSDEAVEKIMTETLEFAFFGRPGESQITGKKWKELFALAFNGSWNDKVLDAGLFLTNKIKSAGGWALVRYLLFRTYSTNPHDRRLFDSPNFIKIDDWTEDFDFPKDVEDWEAARKNFSV